MAEDVVLTPQQRYRASAKYKATLKARLAHEDVKRRHREAVRRFRARMTEEQKAKRREYERQQKHTAAFKARIERYRDEGRLAEWSRRYLQSEKGKAKSKAANAKIKGTQAYAAHNAAIIAVRQGKLSPVRTQTCPCGKPARHYHHHKGYAPEHHLAVVPLCVKCHYAADHHEP